MLNDVTQIANNLADYVCAREDDLEVSGDNSAIILANNDHSTFSLDLTPFDGQPQPADAANIFANVTTADELLQAYHWLLDNVLLDDSVPGAITHVDVFAFIHCSQLVEKGIKEISDQEAQSIAKWLQQLDAYTAVKSLESLLNSPADRVMLDIANEQNWTLLFDHLAIRCGSEARGDAARITDFLCDQHGYRPAYCKSQQHYRFTDGWDAYPVYKQLDNGLLLRLFVDESMTGHPNQIIQHWNKVYGYTAHHLAVRAVHKVDGVWAAVPLNQLIAAVTAKQVNSMEPTGKYSQGLLEQVFTQPTEVTIPDYLEQEFCQIDPKLSRLIHHGKLIELVSRREMPAEFVKRLYSIHGMQYESDNPLHTSPCYTYFLPAQAAHVIRTSVQ